MRRSGGLAEAVPLVVKFGTTLDQIDELRTRLLEYVKAEKREYQPNILTEIRDIVECYSLNLNVVFFYKSNWQNELLRLQRRNKFICAMMVSMQEIGIEGPRRRNPGASENNPFYYQRPGGVNEMLEGSNNDQGGQDGPGPQTGYLSRDPAFVPNARSSPGPGRNPSIMRNGPRMSRPRGESISQMSKRVDFSLGMKDVSSADMMSDLGDQRSPSRLPGMREISASRSNDTHRIPEEDEAERREDEATIRRAESRASRTGNSRSPWGLRRTSTDRSNIKRGPSLVHRNRFFSRNRKKGDGDEEEDLMEQGMAEIPESATPHDRMDPRTGIISPQAVRLSSDSGRSNQTVPAGGLPSFEERIRLQHPAGTEAQDFEMKNISRYTGT